MTNIIKEDHSKTYAIVGPTKECDLMLFGFTSISKAAAQEHFEDFIWDYHSAQKHGLFIRNFQPSDFTKVIMVEVDYDAFGNEGWADSLDKYPVIARGSDYVKDLL